MPHVDIKYFPRDLNDEQKTALAADIAGAKLLPGTRLTETAVFILTRRKAGLTL